MRDLGIEDNIEVDIRGIGCKELDWTGSIEDPEGSTCGDSDESLGSLIAVNSLSSWMTTLCSRMSFYHTVG